MSFFVFGISKRVLLLPINFVQYINEGCVFLFIKLILLSSKKLFYITWYSPNKYVDHDAIFMGKVLQNYRQILLSRKGKLIDRSKRQIRKKNFYVDYCLIPEGCFPCKVLEYKINWRHKIFSLFVHSQNNTKFRDIFFSFESGLRQEK